MVSRNDEQFDPYAGRTTNLTVDTTLLMLLKAWSTRELRHMWLSHVRYYIPQVALLWEIPPDMRICISYYLNLRCNPFLWSDSYVRVFFLNMVRNRPIDFSVDHPDIIWADVFNTIRTAELLLGLRWHFVINITEISFKWVWILHFRKKIINYLGKIISHESIQDSPMHYEPVLDKLRNIRKNINVLRVMYILYIIFTS